MVGKRYILNKTSIACIVAVFVQAMPLAFADHLKQDYLKSDMGSHCFGPSGPKGYGFDKYINYGPIEFFCFEPSGNKNVKLTTKGNTSLGSGALVDTGKGGNNTAVGLGALNKNTSYGNTAVGAYALHKNVKGAYDGGKENTAVGAFSLENNITGKWNVASGYHALWKNKSGSNNTATGAGALRDNSTGNYNTAIGFRAGAKNTRGYRNVFIGYEAGYLNDYRNKSDRLVIANGRHLKNHLILGNFKKQAVFIRGHLSAASFTETSDARLKRDVLPLNDALTSILQLEGKAYRWKENTTFANKADIGLVAQDVERILPELVAEDEQGYKGIAYSKLTVVLIEAMKEQQQQIAALQQENQQLKSAMAEQMDALLARVALLEGVALAAN
jgi:hypothetical protein